MKTASGIYRRFVEFEESAAEIYLRLASRFSKDRELSAFWLDMAIQEKQHAGLLQFCLRDGLFADSLPDSVEIQKVSAFFKRLDKRAAVSKLTVEDAFFIAVEMEASEINTIYSHLTTPLHSSMYLLKRKVATSLPSHIDELLRAARKFRVPGHALQELKRLKEHSSGQWQTRRREHISA